MDLQEDDARRLIARIGALSQPCDLDLLLFFARHPRTLLASEELAAFLGYGVQQTAASLELLLDAGVVTRTPNPKHAARMYVFSPGGLGDGSLLPALLTLAFTRRGRLELIEALRPRAPPERGGRQDGTSPVKASALSDELTGGPEPSIE